MVHPHFAPEAPLGIHWCKIRNGRHRNGRQRVRTPPMAGANRMSPSLLLLHGLYKTKKHERDVRCELTQWELKAEARMSIDYRSCMRMIFLSWLFFSVSLSIGFLRHNRPTVKQGWSISKLLCCLIWFFLFIHCNFFKSTNNHPLCTTKTGTVNNHQASKIG